QRDGGLVPQHADNRLVVGGRQWRNLFAVPGNGRQRRAPVFHVADAEERAAGMSVEGDCGRWYTRSPRGGGTGGEESAEPSEPEPGAVSPAGCNGQGICRGGDPVGAGQ